MGEYHLIWHCLVGVEGAVINKCLDWDILHGGFMGACI